MKRKLLPLAQTREKGGQGLRRCVSLLLALLLLVAFSLPVLGASSTETAPEETAEAPVEEAAEAPAEEVVDEDLTQVTASSGIFRVGMECAYSPYNWTQLDDSNGAVPIAGTSGQYANGYDVQIAKRVAEALGKELVILKSNWDGLVPALKFERIDAIAAGMSATDERKKSIDFSDEYYYSNLVIVLKKDSPFVGATSLKDFSGARLTGQLGTTHFSVIDQIEGVKKQTALESFPAMLVALQAGSIDGYVSEKPGALSAAMADNKLTFVELEGENNFQFDDQEVSIGMGLKKNNPLLPEINKAINAISKEEREEIMVQAIANQPNEELGESFGQTVIFLVQRYGLHFLKGAGTTLIIACIGTIAGLIVGLLIATFRVNPTHSMNPIARALHGLVSFLLTAYVEIIRGTPMMVQAMVFFYGFKRLTGIDMSTLLAGILIVSINTGAYMTEVVRGGIDSVDKGQFEATKAIGMTHSQAMLNIILPQTIRNILPATGNEFVINIKDTSVLNIIAVTELFYASRDVQTNTLAMFETYFITAVIYFILTFTITRILHAVERRMDGPKNYMLTSSTMPASVKMHQKQGRS